MNIVFRVDASLRIGSGHVMRCLCLADALRAAGATTRFLTRHLPTHLADPLRQHGHAILQLPAWDEPTSPVEEAWSEEQRERDLQDCSAALEGATPANWLVVDHYAADRAWEQGARRLARQLAILDDLVREHDCDLLIDSNLYPAGERQYKGRVPAGCRVMTGPGYALLRPEFAQAHAAARVRDGAVRRLLVFLSGMDPKNATGTVLSALHLLSAAERPERIDVVIGANHPQYEALRAACADLSGAALHENTPEMARLCLQADLAVGAGGSNTWERCAVGLPALALQLAPNQARILHNGARAGLLVAPDPAPLEPAALALHLRALLANSGLRYHVSRRALETVDGLGVDRVARALLP